MLKFTSNITLLFTSYLNNQHTSRLFKKADLYRFTKNTTEAAKNGLRQILSRVLEKTMLSRVIFAY